MALAREHHTGTLEHPGTSSPGDLGSHNERPCGHRGGWPGPAVPWPPLPAVLDVFVDEASDQHGNECIVPGADEHQCQAEAHAQEGQGPAESTELSVCPGVPTPRCPGGVPVLPHPAWLTSGSSGSEAASWASAAGFAPHMPG